MTSLFEPLQIGGISAANRIIMAPLTRARAGTERVPNKLMVEYYRQRASAGLIISEATSVSPQGVGYANTPGIWSREQIAGWQAVTDAVHAEGGKIVMQLWHVGRISHSSFLDGELPVAPSALAAQGHVSLLRPETPYETPRALELSELPGIVASYRVAAEHAKTAGFDGVEIHAANGYLIDQFLQDASNKREDEYGGSIANRSRLLLEITDAVASVWGPGLVGVHLAPRGDAHSMGDSNPAALFDYVVQALNARDIAFICTREYAGEDSLSPAMRKAFKGVFIMNENFTQDSAEQALLNGQADAVAFGKLMIANPDLPERFRVHAELNEAQAMQTFYGGGAEGYTDYPTL